MLIFPLIQASKKVTLTYITSATSATDATDYSGSFDATSIGTAAADRQVIVCVYGPRASAGARTATVTIGGVSATEKVMVNTSGGEYIGIWSLTVASGTTANINVVFSAGMLGCAISVYTLNGAATATTDTATNTDTTPLSASITVPSGGAVVAVAASGFNSITSWAWTNATENYDTVFDTNFAYTAASGTTAGTYSVTATATGGTTGGDSLLCAASWATA